MANPSSLPVVTERMGDVSPNGSPGGVDFDAERALSTIRAQRAHEREQDAEIAGLRAALRAARANADEALAELSKARRTIADLAAAVRPDEPSTGRRTADPIRTRAFTLAVDAAWAEWENTRHGEPGGGGSMHAALVAALPFVTQAVAETETCAGLPPGAD